MKEFKIKVPFLMKANDYHEFSNFQYLLNLQSNKKIKFLELNNNGGHYYYAIFYVGSLKSPHNKKYLLNIEKDMDNDL